MRNTHCPTCFEALERRTLLSTVAYWRLEGTPGATASTIQDSSGNGLDGTAYYSPTYDSSVPAAVVPLTAAPDTSSLSFDGSQRVFIPDYPALALTHSITIEAWINASPNQNGFGSQIVLRGDARGGLDPYSLTLVNGNLQFHICDANNDAADVYTPLPAYNTWTHVAAVLDDSTGAMSLYVNGQLANSITTAIRPFAALDPTQTPGLGIGDVETDAYQENFSGLIDEVRISDVALTPSQFLNAPGTPPGSITGSIFNDANANGLPDPGEPPIADVQVFLDSNTNGVLDSGERFTTTGSDGSFAFNNLAPGNYVVQEVIPSGYRADSPNPTGSASVVVNSNEQSTVLFANTQHPLIQGHVFEDLNGNGLRDSGEPALAGWRVYADVNNSGNYTSSDPSTLTNAKGRWTFSNLSPGNYIVRVVPQAQEVITTPLAGSFSAAASSGEQSTGILFGEKPIGTISGNVFNNLNTSEIPISGITMYIDAAHTGMFETGDPTAVTDANGHYVFGNLTSGTYKVMQEIPVGLRLQTPVLDYQTVTFAASAKVKRINFVDTAYANIHGTVFNDINGNGIIDGGDLGMAGWQVYLDLNSSGSYRSVDPSVATDAHGNYVFPDVNPGIYELRIVPKSGYTPTTPVGGYYSLSIGPGSVRGGVLFGEQKAAALAVAVIPSVTGTDLISPATAWLRQSTTTGTFRF